MATNTVHKATTAVVKAKPSGPSFTKEELQALLFAATNNQGLENTGVPNGNEALAKLREALKV